MIHRQYNINRGSFARRCLLCAAVAIAWPAVGQGDAPIAPAIEPTDDAAEHAGDNTSESANANTGPARGFFATRFKQAGDLAIAVGLRDEIEAILGADGSAYAQAEPSIEVRLSQQAILIDALTGLIESERARAILLASQARAVASLAQLQGPEDEQTRQRWMLQLRSVVASLGKLNLPDARREADYWQLLADLADAAHLSAAVDARQVLAEKLLTDYIDVYADDRAADEYVVDARLSLARLLDDRGDQGGVAKLLDAIGELPKDGPRAEQASQLRASISRIGKAIEIEALTTRVSVWKLSEFAGQPVLIHVYADAVEPSLAMIETIRRAIQAGRLGGVAVVSLRVGEPIEGAPIAPWPTLPIGLEPDGVLDRLGVAALPALVWIDARGRVASIGHLPAVLDQLPKPDPETEDPAEEQPDPPAQEG